jgi:cytoskeletal protein CcmA (bactofilin family)
LKFSETSLAKIIACRGRQSEEYTRGVAVGAGGFSTGDFVSMLALARRTNGKPYRDRAELGPSHLGPGFAARGLLESESDLHIHGKVVGRINAIRLILEPGSHIEGDVVAEDVRIAGRFSGRIFAPNVAIDASADVSGRIFHTTVTVARGARVDGRMPWRPATYFETLEDLPETQP